MSIAAWNPPIQKIICVHPSVYWEDCGPNRHQNKTLALACRAEPKWTLDAFKLPDSNWTSFLYWECGNHIWRFCLHLNLQNLSFFNVEYRKGRIKVLATEQIWASAGVSLSACCMPSWCNIINEFWCKQKWQNKQTGLGLRHVWALTLRLNGSFYCTSHKGNRKKTMEISEKNITCIM